MSSKRRKEGYFLRDERLAYGPQAILETVTWTCCHCNTPVVILTDTYRRAHGLPPRTHPRGWCQKCDAYVCDRKPCNDNCTPVEQLIDIALRHPEQPVFLLGPNGEKLFETRLLNEKRIF